MRAPRWKLMICIALERFFEVPIIPAPKRNSKLHSEMWTNPFFPTTFWARGPECETFQEAWPESVRAPGQRRR
jgi:hypothetical protein